MLRFHTFWRALLLTLTVALAVGCADASLGEAGTSAAAATDPGTAREALEKAIERKDATDVRLGRALGRVGAMLTAEQYRAFVRGFNQLPDVAAIEADYHARSSALAIELDAIAADPMAVEEYGARRLFDGYVLLATTPAARSSLVFATRVLAGGLTVRGLGADDVVEQLLGPALAPAFLANLFEKGSADEAVAATTSVLSKGGSTCLSIANWLQQHKPLDGSDLVAERIGISSGTTVQALRTIAGLIAIWEIGSDLVSGDVNAALQQFLDSGPNAVAGIAGGVSLFRRLVLGIESTPFAEQVVRWSGKVAQGIAVVLNAIQLWNDAGKWHDSVEAKVRVVGDVVALGASILVLVGAGPVGPILGVVAIGIHLFADWLEDRRLAEQEQADLVACLPLAGIDATLTQTMVDSSPALITVLARDVKLGPADIQWLLVTDPIIVSEASFAGVRFIGLQVAQIIFELDAAETMALLRAVVGTEADKRNAEYRLDTFLRGIEFGMSFNGGLTKAQGLEWLRAEADSPYLQETDEKALHSAAFLGAASYLATR